MTRAYLYPVFYAALVCFLVILSLEWAFERSKKRNIPPHEMRRHRGARCAFAAVRLSGALARTDDRRVDSLSSAGRCST